MRMCGYYISFEETGVHEIDAILSAVACAAKAYHHTESWNDECSKSYEPDHFSGTTPTEWIQDAANRAARAWQVRKKEGGDANLEDQLQTAKAEGVREGELSVIKNVIDYFGPDAANSFCWWRDQVNKRGHLPNAGQKEK